MNTQRSARHDDGAAALAEGFAQHIERWAGAHPTVGANATGLGLLRRAAFELSLATGNGHVCLRLADLRDTLTAEAGRGDTLAAEAGQVPPSHPATDPHDEAAAEAEAPQGAVQHIDLGTLRSRLLASGVVGTPDALQGRPLLLDSDDRLYLHRHFDYEQRLAQRLLRAAHSAPTTPNAATREQLDALFGRAERNASVDWQKLATALALRQRLVVVSGGPGTGKTSTVVNLLACLIAQDPSTRIALAAPTGKAAARLGEAIAQRATHLPPELRSKLPVTSHTVHRLLGAHPGGFTHHAGNLLAIDVLVVDEASMLDLALATRLLEAVPDSAHIVLLGDKDQLAAVESGAVFAELSADPSLSATCTEALAGLCSVPAADIEPGAALEPSPLHDSVVWFTRNYRFAADSPIARAASDIRQGRAAELIARLGSSTQGSDSLGSDTQDSVRWLDDAQAAPAAATLQCMADGYAQYLGAVQRDAQDVAAVSRAFERFRVLCALREGPRGVVAMNEHLSRLARARLAPAHAAAMPDARSPWYSGRPVMVLRNDPLLKLFNGDIGIVLPAADGELAVHFSDPAGGHRAVPPLRLPAHETAFAMTVHKAQGSEFDALLVLLPAQRSRVLTRELLYTALTRARQRVVLAGAAAVLRSAIDTPTHRHTGLLARLRDEARVTGWSAAG